MQGGHLGSGPRNTELPSHRDSSKPKRTPLKHYETFLGRVSALFSDRDQAQDDCQITIYRMLL